MSLAFGVLGWVLAGMGWTMAFVALFLAIRFRADWSEIWKTAWLLRQTGWGVPVEVQHAMTSRLAGSVPTGGRQPTAEPGWRQPPVDPASVTLPDTVMVLISESSEDWHQREMADTARQMMAGGAGEHEVVNHLRNMLQEAGA